jgi:hypothetical protein
MHGKLNALLEQQVRDGDELARELRKQVGESNAQIHVLRRALLRAGEVNSKLESSKLELSKSLGEAQDLVRGTRRLKEEGPVRWARTRIIIIRHFHIQCRSKHTHFIPRLELVCMCGPSETLSNNLREEMQNDASLDPEVSGLVKNGKKTKGYTCKQSGP